MSQERNGVEPHPRPVIKLPARVLFPSIGALTSLLTLYLLLLSSRRFLLDGDTGLHVRNGGLILESGVIPRVDPFSFSMAGKVWYVWEWLADLLMALAHQSAGLRGVVGGALIVLLLTYGLLYRLMVSRNCDPLLASSLTLFAATCSIVHWLARPHLLSILFLVIWLTMVESYRRGRRRWIFLTPALVGLWANLHGGFSIVFPLLLLYCGGEVGEMVWAGQWKLSRVRSVVLTYGVTGLLTFLAALLTPYGIGLYRHIWVFLNDQELLASVQEFQSPNFHLLDGKLIEIMLLLGMVASFLALKRRQLIEPVLFIFWAHLTLRSERHVTLAAVVIIPIIAEQLTFGLTALANKFMSQENGEGRWRTVARPFFQWYAGIIHIDRQLTGLAFYFGAYIFLIGLSGLFAPVKLTGIEWADKILPSRFSPTKFPVDACNFIESERLAGNGYAHDQFGGYLIYRLWPGYKVFVDGRGDFYRQGTVLSDMEKVALVKPEWATKLDQYEIKWLLLRRDEPLVQLSLMSGGWRKVYEDSVSQVLVRNGQF